MFFYVSKFGISDDDRHEEFKKVKGIRLDIRCVDDPKKINYPGAEKEWYSKGSNHRVEDGKIVRELEDEFYVIRLNSLQDLLDFQKKYGEFATIDNETSYMYRNKKIGTFYYDYSME